MKSNIELLDGKIQKLDNELIQISLETKILIKKFNLLLEKVNCDWSGYEEAFFESYVFNILEEMESLADMCQNYGKYLKNISENVQSKNNKYEW